VILYEDVPTRDSAIQLCGGLSHHFNLDLEFEFTWWKLSYLRDPEMGRQASQAAASADLILISVQPDHDFTAEVKAWFEDWVGKRTGSEGALGLIQASAKATDQPADAYLRLMAQRANMDYLPLPGPEGSVASKDRLREDLNVPDIAGPDQMPKHQTHSSGWGINE